ncbi:hypothetical protein ILUMI_03817 [Ignelater luminosus]|uniref:CRAL-TRIO domain-containing protein n=1 Tax=Ignelater luminosus TaxID=2038154 RepID=A0A8K0GK46_IGNLU|nr:hypothetical protein ILUMI_03817 [Ignelater luminosus]
MEDCQTVFDIEEEYTKNVDLKREDVTFLREWIQNQSKYPEISDFKLLLFLHSCYYDVERTKNTINSYYELRANWPEVFRNRNPCTLPLKPHLDVVVYWPLKQSTKEGYTILYSKLIDTDYTKYDFNQQQKLFYNVVDLYLRTVANCKGLVILLDANGVGWGHLTKFGIFQSRKLMAYIQEAFPIRLKAIHIININTIVHKLFFIARIFMRKELYEMTHLHSDLEDFYNYLPKSILPRDYGGEENTIQELHETMIEMLQNNSDYFVREEEIETTNREEIS